MKISQWCRNALSIWDGALSHKIDYVTIFKEILNCAGHPNHITGSKVMAILLNGWILPIGWASLGRVCSCSLHSRLVSTHLTLKCFKCILHMKKHLYEVLSVIFVERSLRLNGTWKNISKKSTYITLVPSQRYQDSWQLLKIKKVP